MSEVKRLISQFLERVTEWNEINSKSADVIRVIDQSGSDIHSKSGELTDSLQAMRDILTQLYSLRDRLAAVLPAAESSLLQTLFDCVLAFDDEYTLKDTIVRTLLHSCSTTQHRATFAALWRVQPYVDQVHIERLTAMNIENKERSNKSVS
ncbi:uncharacterized protein VTP21DRAFT_2081 [Calcarisporiella thermophila]|uniref:uncharacterized protein n=1 Tax=Calcarisporiella thermophila TaxID=911321 RepID=UPI00374497C3